MDREQQEGLKFPLFGDPPRIFLKPLYLPPRGPHLALAQDEKTMAILAARPVDVYLDVLVPHRDVAPDEPSFYLQPVSFLEKTRKGLVGSVLQAVANRVGNNPHSES